MENQIEIKYTRGKHPNSNKSRFKKGHTVWLGKHLSEDHKNKLSFGKQGSKNPMWKGENIGYGAIHRRIEKFLGKPRLCEHCGTTSAKLFDWANKSGKYYLRLNDWLRLCRKCHIIYDKKGKKYGKS